MLLQTWGSLLSLSIRENLEDPVPLPQGGKLWTQASSAQPRVPYSMGPQVPLPDQAPLSLRSKGVSSLPALRPLAPGLPLGRPDGLCGGPWVRSLGTIPSTSSALRGATPRNVPPSPPGDVALPVALMFQPVSALSCPFDSLFGKRRRSPRPHVLCCPADVTTPAPRRTACPAPVPWVLTLSARPVCSVLPRPEEVLAGAVRPHLLRGAAQEDRGL